MNGKRLVFLIPVLMAVFLSSICAEASADGSLFCPSCGEKIPSDSSFCMFCGNAVVTPGAGSSGVSTFRMINEDGYYGQKVKLFYENDVVCQIEWIENMTFEDFDQALYDETAYYQQIYSKYDYMSFDASMQGSLLTITFQFTELDQPWGLKEFEQSGGVTGILSGSSFISFKENQRKLLEDGWTEERDSDPSLQDSSVRNQLQLILDQASVWSIEDYEPPIGGTNAVTDLDRNGRLEIIGAVNYSTGNLTHIEIYEVNEAKNALNHIGQRFNSSASIIYKGADSIDLLIDSNYPDVLPWEMGSTYCTAYKSSSDGVWNYCFSNWNGGVEENEEIKQILLLKDGELQIRSLAVKTKAFLQEYHEYYNGSGKQITESEYLDWTSIFSGCKKRTAEFSWFSLYNGLTYDMLLRSYQAYHNSMK